MDMNRQRSMSVRSHLSVLASFALCLGPITGCEKGPTLRVVEVESGDGWMSLSPFYGHVFHGEGEEAPAFLPVRDEDLLMGFDAEVFIPVLASDVGALDFEFDAPVVTLADTAIALEVDTSKGADWIRSQTPGDMAALRMIMVGSDLNAETLSLLEQLAAHNPGLTIMVEDSGHLPRLLELFDPVQLILGDASVEKDQEALFAGEPALETLMFSGNGTSTLAFLAQIPNLETVLLADWDPEETGPLPDSLGSLRSLIVVEGGLDDLSALGQQSRLEELTLAFCEEGPRSESLDLSALSGFPQLKILSFQYCPTVVDLSPLGALQNLKWLALPESTTQKQFEEIILTHPGLTLLDLVESEGITDLTPVAGLRELEALLVGAGAPPDPLFGMDGLEYLAVVVEEEDSTFMGEDAFARLQSELPTTVVTRVNPLEFCLGSGFILLLFPLVGGAWWASRRREGRKPA
jgi:Leucine-rich repeat (LRR) protein